CQDHSQHVVLIRERPLPEPFRFHPEAGDDLRRDLAVARADFLVLAVLAEAEAGHRFFERVDDPVFRDAEALVLAALLAVVALDAARGDDFKRPIRRALHECSADEMNALWEYKRKIRLRAIFIVKSKSDAIAENS